MMDKDKTGLNGSTGHAPTSGLKAQGQYSSRDEDIVDGVMLDARVQDAIGRSLKAHYDDLISAPIPDKFLMLLAELEAKEQQHGI